jgi:hypothetical protein
MSRARKGERPKYSVLLKIPVCGAWVTAKSANLGSIRSQGVVDNNARGNHRMDIIKRIGGGLAALALIGGASTAMSVPAAAIGSPNCPDGYTCLWGYGDFTAGTQGYAFFANAWSDLGAFDNKASSYASLDSCGARIYEYTNYDGRSLFVQDLHYGGLVNVAYPGGGTWNNRVSSGQDLC